MNLAFWKREKKLTSEHKEAIRRAAKNGASREFVRSAYRGYSDIDAFLLTVFWFHHETSAPSWDMQNNAFVPYQEEPQHAPLVRELGSVPWAGTSPSQYEASPSRSYEVPVFPTTAPEPVRVYETPSRSYDTPSYGGSSDYGSSHSSGGYSSDSGGSSSGGGSSD